MTSITAQQLLACKKSKVICSVGPDDTIHHAVLEMIDGGVGALLVMRGDTLVGILSERDCARKLIKTGKPAKETLVREFMTPRVVFVRPEQSIEECMALMTEKRVRHLPVMKDGRLLGVLSQGDIVKSVVSNQQFIIQQLENYITGSR
jgi:CBS domain-containing protein